MESHTATSIDIASSENGHVDLLTTPDWAFAKRMEASFLYLDQRAVLDAGVLDMATAMEVVSEAFALHSMGKCHQPHKVVLRDGEDADCEQYGRVNGLFAMIGSPARALGMKWIASFPHNRDRGLPRASALIILNSPENGFPIAVMDGTIISAVRTGAVTALGAQYLAPKGTRKIGIVGAGVQARTQILGLISAIPVEEIAVYNRTRSHAEELAIECQHRWGAPVRTVNSVKDAFEDADIALTVTTALEPIIPACYIKPGALSIQLSGHECDFDVIRQCGKLVTDDWDVLKHRGIITPAVMHAQGLLSDDDIYANLGDLIVKRKPGRESESERIHFAHMGMGIADIALASSVYQRASRTGAGTKLSLWNEPLWA
jgi:ornithine cyclodeaminase/alanine dehydrogenase-like protein (mu-crystallin family)